jgi:hypothetical protein
VKWLQDLGLSSRKTALSVFKSSCN